MERLKTRSSKPVATRLRVPARCWSTFTPPASISNRAPSFLPPMPPAITPCGTAPCSNPAKPCWCWAPRAEPAVPRWRGRDDQLLLHFLARSNQDHYPRPGCGCGLRSGWRPAGANSPACAGLARPISGDRFCRWTSTAQLLPPLSNAAPWGKSSCACKPTRPASRGWVSKRSPGGQHRPKRVG